MFFLIQMCFCSLRISSRFLGGELVGDNDFTIIVSDVVSREIDKHKDSARGRCRRELKR